MIRQIVLMFDDGMTLEQVTMQADFDTECKKTQVTLKPGAEIKVTVNPKAEDELQIVQHKDEKDQIVGCTYTFHGITFYYPC